MSDSHNHDDEEFMDVGNWTQNLRPISLMTCWWRVFSLEKRLLTPSKINMEPENDGLEDDFPFQFCDF